MVMSEHQRKDEVRLKKWRASGKAKSPRAPLTGKEQESRRAPPTDPDPC